MAVADAAVAVRSTFWSPDACRVFLDGQIPETTTLFLLSFSQLLICAAVYNIHSKHCEPIGSNTPLVSAMAILTALYLLLLFLPHDNSFMGGFLQLAYDQVGYRLRFWILALNVGNAILAIGAHFAVKAAFRLRRAAFR